MARAVVSLGSNIGDRAAHLKRAVELLSVLPETKLVKASCIIETEPVDVPEEFSGMRFLNQAAVFETDLSPREFSDRMHAIEEDMGRVRLVRNGPRTIDIDLIDFGGVEMNDPDLILPHPRAKERDFVLVPLAELGVELK
ncbi:MAG: 2-amino-4-hydroxy-6-hydroxymethyldihydropteridine diphosphokinase [Kiritimatiellae bacterium]|nr:2-amino-4-hydroxy-6-hydroxymethyldihydropteridine diphosphokinase [Kiritimatiellia bacterium]